MASARTKRRVNRSANIGRDPAPEPMIILVQDFGA